MKKLFLSLLMAMSALAASAQFEGGTTYFNVSLSGLEASYSINEKVQVAAEAKVGHFIADDWMLFALADYDHRKHQDKFGVGVGTRYYIEQNGLYLNLGVRLEHEADHGRKDDNMYLTPELGYAFFLNRYLTFEPSVYYDMSLNDFNKGSRVGLRIGFGFYF